MRSLLILISLVFLFSCGTRKSNLEVSKSSVGLEKSSFEESKIRKNVTTQSTLSNFNLSWDNETLKNSNAEIDIEETFDKDGKLTGRRTKAKFNSSEHKTEKSSSSKTDSSGISVDRSKVENRSGNKSKETENNSAKKKAVDADKTVAANTGGASWLYFVVISIVVILLIFLWLRKPVKKNQK
jgi:cobalamin biosynthesis Mg chelatase CobN